MKEPGTTAEHRKEAETINYFLSQRERPKRILTEEKNTLKRRIRDTEDMRDNRKRSHESEGFRKVRPASYKTPKKKKERKEKKRIKKSGT